MVIGWDLNRYKITKILDIHERYFLFISNL